MVVCGNCRLPMTAYCTINDRVTCCERCAIGIRERILEVTPRKVAKAAGLGLLGAVGTAGLWILIIQAFISGSGEPPRFGFVIASMVMGSVIGSQVRKGSGGRGGIAFQLLACGLTALAVSYSFAPIVYHVVAKQADVNPVAIALSLVATPLLFLVFAVKSPIFALFMLWGLYDAWRRNVLAQVTVKGPFPLEMQAAPAAPVPASAPPTGAAPPPVAAPVARPVLPPPTEDAKGGGIDFERPQA